MEIRRCCYRWRGRCMSVLVLEGNQFFLIDIEHENSGVRHWGVYESHRLSQSKAKQFEGRCAEKLDDKGKSNNDVLNFSDIYALVKMNPEKNIVQPLLVISFAFVKYMPHKANIWGIKFDTAKQVWKHRIVSWTALLSVFLIRPLHACCYTPLFAHKWYTYQTEREGGFSLL